MVAIPLTAGAYSAQSLLADAQRCVNLYPEKNPPETKPNFPFTLYPRPGLTELGAPPNSGAGRCLYPANNGDLYAVVDQAVYYIDPNWTFTKLGSLLFDAVTPVSMADNGTSAVIVDGSGNGYEILFPTAEQYTGQIATLEIINAGSAGTTGTYSEVALTGGNGSGATAIVTVAGGAVTNVRLQNTGALYQIGDELSAAAASIGNVVGFVVQVTALTQIPANPNRVFAEIADPNFYGSPRADFIDSFLVFAKPNSNEWYSTESDIVVPFNALYIGVKTAWPDNIATLITVEREVYILGFKKSEVWYNAGAVPFPFQILPGNIVEQGCAAVYSAAKMDTNCYWLSQTPEGDRMVMRANSQNVAQRISTHAIEAEWRKYPRIDDAIGSVYQLSGHSFYRLHFPTADKTWVYDEAIGDPNAAWHEENWTDPNGVLHRARDTFNAFSYGKNLGLDWNTGALYQIDAQNGTDNGGAIVCIRSFPHIVNGLKWISFSSFTADLATGTSVNTGENQQYQSPWTAGFSSGFGPLTNMQVPQLNMRISKDGGYRYGNNRIKELVSSGRYRTMQRWRGLGIARDAVFELSFTAAVISALNGAYVELLEGAD